MGLTETGKKCVSKKRRNRIARNRGNADGKRQEKRHTVNYERLETM